MTFTEWKNEWLALKERAVKARSYERYSDILTQHVDPQIGRMLLQRITAVDVDRVYSKLKVAPVTAQMIHIVLKSCLRAAVKKRLIAVNPCDDAEKPGGVVTPEDAETDVDGATLVRLVEAFRSHPSLFPLVAVAAGTGMRRGELLALQWPAVDFSTATVSVVKSVEPTRRFGLRLTTPKSKRSKRTFQVDAGTLAILKGEYVRQQRLVAGVPDGVEVDLTLVKLPPDALVFPAVGPDITAIRHPDGVTAQFLIGARERGFAMNFHAIRSGHETALLDAGISVHVVAERCGHDPAVLLKHYARRTARNDAAAAAAIGDILGRRDNLGTKNPELASVPGKSG